MWVNFLDKCIETVLVDRLQEAISVWVTEFMTLGDESTNAPELMSHKTGSTIDVGT